MTSTYDKIKAEMGPTPPYAARADFKKFHGYAFGKPIEGSPFATAEAAKKAGANTTEPEVDEEGFRAAQKAYSDHMVAVGAAWEDAMRKQHPEVSDEVFAIVSSEAYRQHHSYGYSEVENQLPDMIDFAVRIITASRK